MKSTLAELGWNSFFDQQVLPDEEILLRARVASHHGSQLVLLTENGELNVHAQLVESCGPIGVGDWLLLESETSRAAKRLDRDTVITRKAAGELAKEQIIAANVNTLFIVCSCNLEFNLSRIERYLAIAIDSHVTPIVVLTKADLCDDPADYCQQTQKLHPGLIVESMDARQHEQIKVLEYWCRAGQTIALVGSSGVGKSTLANSLGADEIKTGGIREDDAKGRHTTTARMMHRIRFGGLLIDNPGMRELQLPSCEQGVEELFDDVIQLAAKCKFRDCRHDGDVGCAIADAVESGDLDQRRFKSFIKLRSEQERNSETLAQRREKGRRQGKFYKTVLKNKRTNREQF